MNKKLCDICGSYTLCHKHHLIPKDVLKKTGNLYKRNNLVNICVNCHKKIHYFNGSNAKNFIFNSMSDVDKKNYKIKVVNDLFEEVCSL